VLLSRALDGQKTAGILNDQVQAQLVIQRVCGDGLPPKTLCEVGFRTGSAALLFLEAVPNSRVVAFGPSDAKPAVTAVQLLSQAYPGRFEAVFGSSTWRIPERQRAHADERCDVVVMDEAQDYGERLIDIVNIRSAATPGALVVLRQICSMECARSSTATWSALKLPCSSCHGGASLAYSKAHQLGLLRIETCSIPNVPSKAGNASVSASETSPDGVCTALFGESDPLK